MAAIAVSVVVTVSVAVNYKRPRFPSNIDRFSCSSYGVGRLVPGVKRPAPLHERVFFFMAYMNLVIVFLIVLILALWRWW